MKIKINYCDKIINLPAEQLYANLGSMTADELKVLLFACSEPEFRADTDAERAKAIKTLDMQWAAIESALSYLFSRGFLSSEQRADTEVPAVQDTKKKPKASVKADVPVYSKDETAGIISRNEDLKKIINDDVPRIIGKSVNQNEAMILVSMYDYLRMPAESIVKIVSYCASNNMMSFRFVERTAYSLFDSDITDPAGIDEYIEREQRKNRITERIRELFGIGKRALIAREKNLIKTWTDVYGYDMDMITRAYEITIKSIGEPSLDYTGAVLKRWYDQGIKTLSDVDKEEENGKKIPAPDKKKKTANQKSEAQSFDADEFMAAAMRRSYGGN